MKTFGTVILTAALGAILTIGLLWVMNEPIPVEQKAFFTTSTTIYVEESVNGVWDSQLRSALAYVDKQTGKTSMVLGHCREGYRCLRIRFGNPGRGLIGVERASIITLRKTWSGYRYNSNSRRNLIIHELGHYFGLGHTRTPVSVMYPNLYHNGYRMRASTFNKAQLAVLRNA